MISKALWQFRFAYLWKVMAIILREDSLRIGSWKNRNLVSWIIIILKKEYSQLESSIRFCYNWPSVLNFFIFSGESERTLVIKMGNCLNEFFCTIATSTGIVEKDLAACFPCLFPFTLSFLILNFWFSKKLHFEAPMLLYCNPGEVHCRVMNYAHLITVWTGDVNADVNYTPVPAGIAFFCDTPNALDNVLNSNNGNLLGEAS